MTRALFVTATGTGVGKTWVVRGLARALRDRGRRVVAVKPYETGCAPDPLDAIAIARAAGGTEAVAHARGLYRARSPVAPYAATLAGETPPRAMSEVIATVRALCDSPDDSLRHIDTRTMALDDRPKADVLLVEGAGGLLVPIDRERDLADFAAMLDAPVLIVARDALGVLSHVLTVVAAARARGLEIKAIALVRHLDESDSARTQSDGTRADASRDFNAQILAERCGVPIVPIDPCTKDDDAALAHDVARAGLLEALGWDD